MPSNSAIKAGLLKNVYEKSIDFGKTSVHKLDLNPRPPKCRSAALSIELYGCGFDEMLLEFFLLHRLQLTAER